MGYMEISLQGLNSLKIRGKHAAIFINPQDKTSSYNAAVILGNPLASTLKIRDDVVIINGPGEYEAGGIKITGTKAETNVVYSISLDNVDLLVGDRADIEKTFQKLKEYQIVIIHAGDVGTATFAPSLGINAVLFFGEHAREVVDTVAKDQKKETTKYVISGDKLPTERETVLLVSSS